MFRSKLKSLNWKYVVGEVLLIFIGITMAIWFDTWNNDRIIEKKKAQAISKIREEIEHNMGELKTAREINEKIPSAVIAFRELRAEGYESNKGEVMTTEAMRSYQQAHPGFFNIKDSVALGNGLYEYMGDSFINLELAALTDIAWETTKDLRLADEMGFDCLYDLENLYNVQNMVLKEINKSSEALQNQDINRLLRVLEFISQLDRQLERHYQNMLDQMDICE